MTKYKVVEFGKPALRKMGPVSFKPAEQLQQLLDQEDGDLVGVVPLAYGALLIFTTSGA